MGASTSQTLATVQILVSQGKLRISEHGYNELAADGLFAGALLDGLDQAEMVEDYPNYPKGPCVLVLQRDSQNAMVHVLWGIAKGTTEPAVLVTAYRPDPNKWDGTFLRRR
jgi:hypothetical protein